MSVTVNSSGWISMTITNNIPKFLGIFKKKRLKTMKEIGIFVTNNMKKYAPVDTGWLRSRCDYRIDFKGNLRLINDVHYAGFQEFGTYKMRAHPYMRPAVFNHIGEINNIAGRTMLINES